MAIARDNITASSTTTGATLTFSHTNTAGTILWVGVVSYNGTDVITGVTYNGVSMTRALAIAQGANGYVYLYYLASPATGANDVVVSQSASVTIQAVAASYTGASTTGIPDTSNTATGTSGSSTVSVTTVADNCWGVGVTWTNRTNSDGTLGAIIGGLTSQFSMFDSNSSLTPAGSKVFDITMFSSSSWAIGVSTFKPIGGATVNSNMLMFM